MRAACEFGSESGHSFIIGFSSWFHLLICFITLPPSPRPDIISTETLKEVAVCSEEPELSFSMFRIVLRSGGDCSLEDLMRFVVLRCVQGISQFHQNCGGKVGYVSLGRAGMFMMLSQNRLIG